MSVVFFDLNALVPNLKGAFQEGVAAAFRTVDLHLDDDMTACALGKTYAEGVQAIYRHELRMPLPDEQTLASLSRMYQNVVGRFVQFSPSLFASPRTADVITGLKTAGCKVGLVTELDAATVVSLMGRLGWDAASLFDTVVTADGAQNKDEMLAVLIERIPPAGGRRIYVGALVQDALPAHLLGCDRILIRDADEAPQSASGEVHCESFHSMTDLADMLRNPSLESAD